MSRARARSQSPPGCDLPASAHAGSRHRQANGRATDDDRRRPAGAALCSMLLLAALPRGARRAAGRARGRRAAQRPRPARRRARDPGRRQPRHPPARGLRLRPPDRLRPQPRARARHRPRGRRRGRRALHLPSARGPSLVRRRAVHHRGLPLLVGGRRQRPRSSARSARRATSWSRTSCRRSRSSTR